MEDVKMSGEYNPNAKSNPDVLDFTTESLQDENTNQNEVMDEEGPTSSLENVIPVDKLKKGWWALSSAFMQGAEIAKQKAEAAYNSEEFKAVREKTTEIVAPAWEKTVEVTAPIWEKTKATCSVAYETTKEKAAETADKMRPTFEQLGEKINTAVVDGWESFSHAASNAAEYTGERVSNLAGHMNEGSAPTASSEYPASAMDTAARGGPMTL